MVPPDSIAGRLVVLAGFVADPPLSWGELDMLAGAKTKGHAKQIASGEKIPGPQTVERFAPVFGVEPAWIMFATGARPRADEVRAAVERARRRLSRRGRHAPKVSSRTGARKAARAAGVARSAGAPR